MSSTTTVAAPKQVRGTWKLTSSMVHGGDETLGTTTLFRTEGFVYQGRKIQLPVVTGNAIAGIWRRYMARAFLDAYLNAGGEPLSRAAFYYLTSGGSLTRRRDSGVLDLTQQRSIRDLVPYVGLYGGSGLGRMQPGKFYCDFAYPICRETVPLLSRIHPQVEEAETAGISYRDLTQIRGYSRKDDAKDEEWWKYLAPAAQSEIKDELKHKEDSDEADAPGSPQQMRHHQQELVMGTDLFHRWGFKADPTRDEFAGFGAGLLRWAERPHAGGRNNRGHGNFLPQYIEITPETKLIGTGDEPLEEMRNQTVEEAVQEHVRANLEDIQVLMRAL